MPISIKQKRSSRVRYTLKKRNKDRLRMSVFKSAKNLYITDKNIALPVFGVKRSFDDEALEGGISGVPKVN